MSKEITTKSVIGIDNIKDECRDQFFKSVNKLFSRDTVDDIIDEEFDCNVVATLMPAQKQTMLDEGHDAFLEDFYVDIFNDVNSVDVTELLTDKTKNELEFTLIEQEREKEFSGKFIDE